MSAEILRRAAALMRERAEKIDGWYGPQAWATASPMSLPIEKADAEHIASWHPAVALAVADWLDHAARHAEVRVANGWPYNDGPADPRALRVARAYLGEAADD